MPVKQKKNIKNTEAISANSLKNTFSVNMNFGEECKIRDVLLIFLFL